MKNISNYFYIKNLINDIWFDKPYGVNTHCIYSKEIDTLKTLVLDHDFNYFSYNQIYSNGDGTVPLESLQLCHFINFDNIDYFNKLNKTLTFEVYNGIDHSNILKHPKSLNSLKYKILKIIYQY